MSTTFRSRSADWRWVRFALPVLATFCFVGSARSLELRIAAGDTEVGGPVPPLKEAPPPTPSASPSLEHELEVGLGWLVLSEDDMHAVYGELPVAQVRLSLQPGPGLRFWLGSGYGRTVGSPYHGQDTFAGGEQARLQVMPIQMGLRINLLRRDDFRLNLGFVLEAVWVWETLPDVDLEDDPKTESGLTGGAGLTFGPEWRWNDLRRAIGFEAGLTGNSGSLGDTRNHDANLSGLSGRVYFSTRI